MGHPRRTLNGRGLSPFAVLCVLAERAAGATLSELSQRFGASRSTIARWAAQWGYEGAHFAGIRGGGKERLMRVHRATMEVADASDEVHKSALTIHSLTVWRCKNEDIDELLANSQKLEDAVRQLETTLLSELAAIKDSPSRHSAFVPN